MLQLRRYWPWKTVSSYLKRILLHCEELSIICFLWVRLHLTKWRFFVFSGGGWVFPDFFFWGGRGSEFSKVFFLGVGGGVWVFQIFFLRGGEVWVFSRFFRGRGGGSEFLGLRSWHPSSVYRSVVKPESEIMQNCLKILVWVHFSQIYRWIGDK